MRYKKIVPAEKASDFEKRKKKYNIFVAQIAKFFTGLCIITSLINIGLSISDLESPTTLGGAHCIPV